MNARLPSKRRILQQRTSKLLLIGVASLLCLWRQLAATGNRFDG
jgi:hypothetical protein